MHRIRLGLLAAALLSTPIAALAADATIPHEHKGVLPAYTGMPSIPTLTAEDLAILDTGKNVLKQTKDGKGSGGKGIAVQDIHADPTTIWSRITSYSNYPKWVKGVYECETYSNTADHIKTRMVIGGMGVKKEYFIDHKYTPGSGYMTWTLDYSRNSDFDDTVGFWRVEALPGKPGWSRVYYSVQVKLKGWVPGFIQAMLTKDGLVQATEWVKRESEKAAGH